MIQLTVNGQAVNVSSGDIVRDTLTTDVGVVPFEWSTGFTVQQAVDAITAYLTGDPLEVQSTGAGWIIDLPSETHPQAEITGIDFVTNLINFRWIGSSYSGDCATPFTFTIDTTAGDLVTAVMGVLS